jgi:DNA-binding protein H-NS
MTEEKVFDFSMFSDRQIVSLLSQVYAEILERRERARVAREKLPKLTEAPPAARYRNPDNAAETWSGKGPLPSWMRAALAAGIDLATLLEMD